VSELPEGLSRNEYINEWLPAECRRRAEAIVPEDIAPSLWHRHLWGPRIVVLQWPEEVFHDGEQLIAIPEKYREPPCAGWVLLVGPDICYAQAETTHCPYTDPEDLVGHVVSYSRWAGVTLMSHTLDDPFKGRYIEMHIGDVHATLSRPKIVKETT
jgi:hypothetical protein